jgi:putative membrane-bound dehydrogenase-like protein
MNLRATCSRAVRGLLWAAALAAASALGPAAVAADGPLRVGAAVIDISPRAYPVEVNGSFLTRTLHRSTGPLAARAVVFERGGEVAALVVVDSCMVPRDVCDAIKRGAAEATGIPTERMLVAATHTHSAPSVMDFCLGTMRDEAYTAQFIPQVAEAIARAHERLEPALVGAAAVDAWDLTYSRRWVKRSDRIGTDPFGVASVRANMHPSSLTDSVGPAGPVDPALTVLSVVRPDGRPIAVLANFSMHYLGAQDVSPDYFGPFAEAVERAVDREHPGSGCVAIMSQGTSGDLHQKTYDVDNPPRKCVFHEELAGRAVAAMRGIRHAADAPLAMAQAELSLGRRVPDDGRLAWARRFEEARGDRRPKSMEEVYAMQAAWLHEHPRSSLLLQALRIGDLAITALPNEVYALTGLKLKRQSPLPLTMNIELANGAEGYIPPPEQHVLGGYTTWPASTAGLEVAAEPRIVEAVLGLLEKVAGKPRRSVDETPGQAARAVLDLRPHAYWRLEEMSPPRARDAAGERHAMYEDGVAVYLPGVGGDADRDMATAAPVVPSVFSGPEINRAAHCAGGRIKAAVPDLPVQGYSVSLWLWNGYPVAERPVAGFVLSRGASGSAAGDHVGIGGSAGGHAGRLILSDGERTIAGRRPLAPRRWHHVVFVRDASRVRVYLDGAAEPDLEADLPSRMVGAGEIFIGGRSDGVVGLEGKVDEVAVFDRPLAAVEVGRMYAATGRPAAAPPPDEADGPAEAAAQPVISDQPPLPPEQAREQVFVPEGFTLELAAVEPQVLDPVAFDWDAAGRLWVVEMADYPLGMDGKGLSGGRIRVLEDVDADGRYEKATLFADGLNFPNGCLTWRDGVIVTAAPEILFLADTDGDGRADRREVLVSGLAEGNQQLRPNGLRWGLDNWVYVASGSPGGWFDSTLVSARSGAKLAVGSRDFRFRPDTGELETETGPTQFGRNRDDWGHWFGSQNAKPLWHYVLAARYAARNPYVALGALTQPVLPADVAVHPAQPPEKRYHNFHQAGHYTSACGGVIHRDPRLFGADETAAFVCEPFHNLVQRVRVREAGVSFVGAPVVADGRDFLTSTDRWFRPVMVRTGPDGALWVADMYRFMIEHPDWLPPEGKGELLPRYRHGDDRGRIYRIAATGAARQRIPDLRPLDGPGLVAVLASENGFLRDKAHQMLLWRGGDDAVTALRLLARDPGRPLGSLHALCVLDGLGKLEAADLGPALAAGHPGLRENALRLAEPWLAADKLEPAIVAAVAAATSDTQPRVRFQAALAAGAGDAPEVGVALGRLLVAHGHEPFMDAAILSAAPRHVTALAAAAAAVPGVLDRVLAPLVQVAIGTKTGPALVAVLTAVNGRPGDAAATARLGLLLDGLAAAKTDLASLAGSAFDEATRREAERVQAFLEATVSLGERDDAPAAERLAAALVATRSAVHRDRGVGVLAALLTPTQAPDFQQRVVRALAASGSDAVPGLLAAFWPQCSPTIRPAVVDAWLGRPAWCRDLLGRIERGDVKITALDASARSRLVKHRSQDIAELARRVLGAAAGSRAGVIERYRPALANPGDEAKGLAVYRRVCATCHRHDDEGREIGPDVRTFAGHPPEKILANIFDPSSDIQPGYHAFVCTLDSGEQLYGIVTGETDSGIRFKCADATEKTILRSQIESLTATNVSFMPEGLEASLSPADVADLIAFLRQPPAGAN